ncbi:MAG: TlpA family protein disulfide reductase [Candidatus Omnitrophica bacterium]|nr:TlpA family protein disulfide reductase [Candidatus Omnitrophota bacterium]
MGRKKWFIIFLVSLLVTTAGLMSCQGQGPSGSAQAMAPDFTLKDLEGNPFSLSNVKGKVVILDFWATWCPPCRMEIPHFQALSTEYKDKGLVVIGIALDDGGAAVVGPFAKSNGVTYPILIGNQQVAAAYGGIRGIPTTFIIDRKGRIVEKYVGYRDKEVFESAIKDHL